MTSSITSSISSVSVSIDISMTVGRGGHLLGGVDGYKYFYDSHVLLLLLVVLCLSVCAHNMCIHTCICIYLYIYIYIYIYIYALHLWEVY